MNNISNYLRTILLVLLFSSCTDAVDVLPQDEVLESNAITSVDDVETARFAVYGTMPANTSIFWNSLFTDELRLPSSNNGQGVQVHTWSIDAGDTAVESLFSNYYGTINRANRLLALIPNIEAVNSEDQDRLDQYEGELLAIRAWAHFKLFTYFSTSYTNDEALSVPYVDTVIVLETPPRNTVGEVVAAIKDDLNIAFSKIPASYSPNNFFTRPAIQALQSRLALYTGDYQTAIQKATQLISNSQFQLADTSNYALIWSDTENSENIFKLSRVTGESQVGQLFTPAPGQFYWLASDKITNSYEDNDVRKFVFIDFAGNQAILKYPGVPGNIGLNDIKLFRLSEQYLIRAEAYAMTGQTDSAENDINTLRQNRYLGNSTIEINTGAQAINIILEERFKEFPFEGHRFFDLKRLGLNVERLNSDCDILSATACDLPSSNFLFTLPIPQGEIFTNDNMIQNPGY